MADDPLKSRQEPTDHDEVMDHKTLNSFVDSSVEVGHFNRDELVAMLQLPQINRKSTIQMQLKLRKYLKSEHSIHDFLKILPQTKIKRLHQKICPDSTLEQYTRMPAEIAEYFLVNHPKNPLTSLRYFIEQDSNIEMSEKEEETFEYPQYETDNYGQFDVHDSSEVKVESIQNKVMKETDTNSSYYQNEDRNEFGNDIQEHPLDDDSELLGQDDYSVDVTSLTRIETLNKLQLSNSRQSSEILRRRLNYSLRKSHPIHNFLNGFSKSKIKSLHKKVCPNSSNHIFNKITREIAKFFFENYPQSPLTILKTFTEQDWDEDLEMVAEEEQSQIIEEDTLTHDAFDQTDNLGYSNDFLGVEVEENSDLNAFKSVCGSEVEQDFIKDNNDPSIDVSEWSRPKIMARLQLKSAKITTKQLARRLRKKIVMSHPIHDYLNDLPSSELKLVYSKIIDMKRDLNNGHSYKRSDCEISRMKKIISRTFFLMYPKSPLTCLKNFIENRCVDKLELPKSTWDELLDCVGTGEVEQNTNYNFCKSIQMSSNKSRQEPLIQDETVDFKTEYNVYDYAETCSLNEPSNENETETVNVKNANSFVDSSVEVGHLNREELAAQLQCSKANRQSTLQMRFKLKKYLRNSHHIHKFLKCLSYSKIRSLHKKVCPTSGSSFSRFPREIAKFFFDHYPKFPLTTLKSFIEQDWDLEELKTTGEQQPDKSIGNYDTFDQKDHLDYNSGFSSPGANQTTDLSATEVQQEYIEENPMAEINVKNFTIQNDPSVDVTNWSRTEILSKLPPSNSNYKSTTKNLARKLRKFISRSHPIHQFLNGLPQTEIKLAYEKILEMKRGWGTGHSYNKIPTYLRMKQQISKTFFIIYPKCPLTSLKEFFKNGCVDLLEMPESTFDEETQQEFIENNEELPVMDTNEFFIEDDPSVNVKNWSRSEILSRLPHKNTHAKISTTKLRRMLRNFLAAFHPIHKLLNKLPIKHIKFVHLKVCDDEDKKSYRVSDRMPFITKMKKQIAKAFFENYPNSPMSCLRNFLIQNKHDINLQNEISYTFDEEENSKAIFDPDLEQNADQAFNEEPEINYETMETDSKNKLIQEDDVSVDVSSLTRQELIIQLQLPEGRQSTKKMQVMLRNSIARTHPIHNFLRDLSREQVKLIHAKVCKHKTEHVARMPKEIATSFFQMYPGSPLTSLRYFIKQGCPDIPDSNFETNESLEDCEFDVDNNTVIETVEVKQEVIDEDQNAPDPLRGPEISQNSSDLGETYSVFNEHINQKEIDYSEHDFSVDVTSFTRSELLKKIPSYYNCSKQSTEGLKITLKNHLRRSHPIVSFLNHLPRPKLKFVWKKVCPSSTNRKFQRMQKEVAKFFFENHPKSPLTTLKDFIEQKWDDTFETTAKEGQYQMGGETHVHQIDPLNFNSDSGDKEVDQIDDLNSYNSVCASGIKQEFTEDSNDPSIDVLPQSNWEEQLGFVGSEEIEQNIDCKVTSAMNILSDTLESKSNHTFHPMKSEIRQEVDQEDLSIDLTHWTRQEVIAKLGSKRTNYNSDRLKRMLRRSMMISHPIHEFLATVSGIKIKLAYSKILEMKRDLKNGHSYNNQLTFARMRHEIARTFFLIYPQSPLTSVKQFFKNGCVEKLELPLQSNFDEEEGNNSKYFGYEKVEQNNDCNVKSVMDILFDPFESKSNHIFDPTVSEISQKFDPEDLSIDLTHWTRQQVIAQLGLKSASSSSQQLKRKLRRSMTISHPIHKFLGDLSDSDIKLAYSKIIDMKRSRQDGHSYNKMPTFARMRQGIAKTFFLIHPQSPLTSVKQFFQNGCVDKLEITHSIFDEGEGNDSLYSEFEVGQFSVENDFSVDDSSQPCEIKQELIDQYI